MTIMLYIYSVSSDINTLGSDVIGKVNNKYQYCYIGIIYVSIWKLCTANTCNTIIIVSMNIIYVYTVSTIYNTVGLKRFHFDFEGIRLINIILIPFLEFYNLS